MVCYVILTIMDKIESQERRPNSIKQRAVRATGALLIGTASILGAGQNANSIEAGDDSSPTPATTPVKPPTVTPTLSPTPSSTPDALATQLADKRSTATAVARDDERNKEMLELQRKIDEKRNPPTATATATLSPSPTVGLNPADVAATSTARQDEAFGREKARLEAEYYKTHPSPTTAPVPTATPTVSGASRGTEQNQGGIPGVLWAVLGGAVTLSAAYRQRIFAKKFRRSVGNLMTNLATNARGAWNNITSRFRRHTP